MSAFGKQIDAPMGDMPRERHVVGREDRLHVVDVPEEYLLHPEDGREPGNLQLSYGVGGTFRIDRTGKVVETRNLNGTHRVVARVLDDAAEALLADNDRALADAEAVLERLRVERQEILSAALPRLKLARVTL